MKPDSHCQVDGDQGSEFRWLVGDISEWRRLVCAHALRGAEGVVLLMWADPQTLRVHWFKKKVGIRERGKRG